MQDIDLLFTSATTAASLIRSGALSPVAYVETVLAAIEREQPRLNCFIEVMAAQARTAARVAEEQVRNGAPLGPLHGVPVHIKDLIDVAGVPTRHGSAIFTESPPAAEDDILVARLKQAGAIIIGKTTTPEFGNKGLTDGPSFGVTRNPWNTERTPGGSSGGAAAAVAAGLGPLGLGTDGAGSVRGPASCCGLVGFKPTLGAVPYDSAPDAFGSNLYAGPLARSVADAATMHAVLAGPSGSDPWSQAGAKNRAVSASLLGNDLSAIRIGYVERCANPRVAADVADRTRACLDAWQRFGAAVEAVDDAIDWIELEGRILYQAGFSVLCRPFLPTWRERMDPVIQAWAERGSRFSVADYREAELARTRLFRQVQKLFQRYDFLVMPTNSRTALPVAFDAANEEVEVDGVKCGITRQGWTSYQYPFNLTGHPALSVPSGFGDDGLPTGIQIVGRWGQDDDVFRLAAFLEQARPWAQHRPPSAPSLSV